MPPEKPKVLPRSQFYIESESNHENKSRGLFAFSGKELKILL
jgi:hypothetical protein